MEISALYQLYHQFPSVQTDTRKLKDGDIFFALKGPSFNGNTFAKQALEMGAAYAVIDEPEYKDNDQCLLVDDVLETLQDLAKYHRQQFDIPFIAITGSNGKTTTKELIATALGAKYKTYATEGNLNNHIGVPLTLLKIKDDAEMAIIEMGANHLHEIAGYCEVALPTHGIITNCGKAHIEGFGSIEGVRKGKGELYDYLRAHDGVIFRNTDLDYLEGMSAGIRQQVTYGSANAHYIGKLLTGDIFVKLALLNSGAEATIETQLVGDYNFPNVMTAVAIGLHFGVPVNAIKKVIAAYNPDNSRSQLIKRGSNTIILDAYNANPTSMKAAINNFASKDMAGKVVYLGGMKEMGDTEKQEHIELVSLLKEHTWANVILVGKEFEGIQKDYQWFLNSEEAAESVKKNPPQSSSILIKGSRGSKMEKILEALPGN